jgi:hypothetical protein
MRAVGKAVAAFVVVLLVLGFVTFVVIRMFGMDLSLP